MSSLCEALAKGRFFSGGMHACLSLDKLYCRLKSANQLECRKTQERRCWNESGLSFPVVELVKGTVLPSTYRQGDLESSWRRILLLLSF